MLPLLITLYDFFAFRNGIIFSKGTYMLLAFILNTETWDVMVVGEWDKCLKIPLAMNLQMR